MLNLTSNISSLLAVVGALVVVTNIIVEVLKQFTAKAIPTNMLAVAVSLLLTLAAFFAWCSYMSIAVVWYHIAAAVAIGFFVAYAAMFGFDKLKQMLEQLK